MTTLEITPNWQKKTAKFKGTVAAGELVAVTVKGAAEWATATGAALRLRVVGMGEDLAHFPPDESELEDGETMPTWDTTTSEGDAICDLNLDTDKLLAAVPPAATVPLLFVLDDAGQEADGTPVLYFKDVCDVTHWPQRTGEDNPKNLRDYRDFVEEAKAAIAESAQAASDAKAAATAAQESAAGSQNSAAASAEAAGISAATAQSQANAARNAATDAQTAQTAAETAQGAAETAQGKAEDAVTDAEAWAVGERNGTAVESGDETYHNNAKYYAEQAQEAAESLELDDTLTEEGKAADAKAAGDAIAGKVPTSRTVNGNALTGDVTLTGADIAVSGTDATKIDAALALKASKSDVDPLLFSQYYPDGSVKSAAEFTPNIKYTLTTNEMGRTAIVNPFCDTGDRANDNVNLVGSVVIPPFVDMLGNGYISDDGTRFKVVGVSGGSSVDYSTSLTDIIAPNTVTTVGNKAFSQCTSLTSVSIPAAQTIGEEAFAECLALTSVSIPAAQTIGEEAFTYCISLTSVSLPAATNIGFSAFKSCGSLASVDFGDTPRSSVPTLDAAVFDGVPTSCKIIVPYTQYDEWTAADGWKDLPQEFVRHAEKAEKPATFTAGNLAALDANGNPTDSGVKPSDKLDSTSAAPAFSTSSTYAVDKHVTYNGKLYRCTTAVTTAGAWDASKWTADTMTDPDAVLDISARNQLRVVAKDGTILWAQGYDLASTSSATLACDATNLFTFAATSVSAFSDAATYAVDDRVTYGGKTYKCTTAVETAGAWTGSANWTEDPDVQAFSLPSAATGKVGDFGLDVDNTANAATSMSASLTGLDTTFSVVVPKGESLTDMLSIAAGELARFYVTLTTFRVNNLPTWHIIKQVVENGGATA